jgi:hypothetical protein
MVTKRRLPALFRAKNLSHQSKTAKPLQHPTWALKTSERLRSNSTNALLPLGGEFLSRLFRIRLSSPETEQWSEIRPRGGKELDMRVVAHSAAYHAAADSLLVYGGVVTGVARFSKLSDRMFAFRLDTRHWAEIMYPRAQLRDTYVPRERAFHTSTIIGECRVIEFLFFTFFEMVGCVQKWSASSEVLNEKYTCIYFILLRTVNWQCFYKPRCLKYI